MRLRICEWLLGVVCSHWQSDNVSKQPILAPWKWVSTRVTGRKGNLDQPRCMNTAPRQHLRGWIYHSISGQLKFSDLALFLPVRARSSCCAPLLSRMRSAARLFLLYSSDTRSFHKQITVPIGWQSSSCRWLIIIQNLFRHQVFLVEDHRAIYIHVVYA